MKKSNNNQYKFSSVVVLLSLTLSFSQDNIFENEMSDIKSNTFTSDIPQHIKGDLFRSNSMHATGAVLIYSSLIATFALTTSEDTRFNVMYYLPFLSMGISGVIIEGIGTGRTVNLANDFAGSSYANSMLFGTGFVFTAAASALVSAGAIRKDPGLIAGGIGCALSKDIIWLIASSNSNSAIRNTNRNLSASQINIKPVIFAHNSCGIVCEGTF